MKKIITLISIASAAIILGSCAKEEPSGVKSPENTGNTEIVAHINDVKTTLDGLSLTWKDGDVISAFNFDQISESASAGNTALGNTYTIDSECDGTKTGIFRADNEEKIAQGSNKYFAIYNPGTSSFSSTLCFRYEVPCLQSYRTPDEKIENTIPMVGKGDELSNMAFESMCSIIRFPVYADGDITITSARLETNYYLSRYYHLKFENNGYSFIGPTSADYDYIQLDLPAGGLTVSKNVDNPTYLSFICPTGTNLGYLTLKLDDETDTYVKTKSSQVTLSPNAVLNVAAVKLEDILMHQVATISINGEAPVDLYECDAIPVAGSTVVVKTVGTEVLSISDLITINSIIKKTPSTVHDLTLDLSDAKVSNNEMLRGAMGSTNRLGKVILPTTLKKISNGFDGEEYLTDIVLPDGIETVTSPCSSSPITALYIPASVTSLNLYDMKKILSYDVAETNTIYASDADGVVFSKNKKELVSYPSGRLAAEYTVPAGVTVIKNYAFQNNQNLETLTLPESVTSIGAPFSFAKKINKIIVLRGKVVDNKLTENTTLNAGLTYNDDNAAILPPAGGVVVFPAGTSSYYMTIGKWADSIVKCGWTYTEPAANKLSLNASIGLSDRNPDVIWE